MSDNDDFKEVPRQLWGIDLAHKQFLADVLDAMYLAVKKWGMGKKSSVVIGFLYVLMLAGVIWGAVKVFG